MAPVAFNKSSRCVRFQYHYRICLPEKRKNLSHKHSTSLSLPSPMHFQAVVEETTLRLADILSGRRLPFDCLRQALRGEFREGVSAVVVVVCIVISSLGDCAKVKCLKITKEGASGEDDNNHSSRWPTCSNKIEFASPGWLFKLL